MKAFCAKSLRLRPDYNAERERGNQRLHACPETTRCPTTCYERIGTYQEMAWPSTTSQTRKNSSLIRLEGAAATVSRETEEFYYPVTTRFRRYAAGGSRPRSADALAVRRFHRGLGRAGRRASVRHVADHDRPAGPSWRPRQAVDGARSRPPAAGRDMGHLPPVRDRKPAARPDCRLHSNPSRRSRGLRDG